MISLIITFGARMGIGLQYFISQGQAEGYKASDKFNNMGVMLMY